MNYPIIFFTILLAISPSFSKCMKFFDYRTKTLDVEGIQVNVGKANVGLGKVDRRVYPIEITDSLMRLDLLQCSICEQINKLKDEKKREELRETHIKILMKMMNLSQTEIKDTTKIISDSCQCLNQNDTIACNKYFSQLVDRRVLQKILDALTEVKMATIQWNEAKERLKEVKKYIANDNINTQQSKQDIMAAEQQTRDAEVRLEKAKSSFRSVWIDPNVILPSNSW